MSRLGGDPGDLDPAGAVVTSAAAAALAFRPGAARAVQTAAGLATSTRRHDAAHQELALEPRGVARSALGARRSGVAVATDKAIGGGSSPVSAEESTRRTADSRPQCRIARQPGAQRRQ